MSSLSRAYRNANTSPGIADPAIDLAVGHSYMMDRKSMAGTSPVLASFVERRSPPPAPPAVAVSSSSARDGAR